MPHSLGRAELLNARLTARLSLIIYFLLLVGTKHPKILLQHFFGYFHGVSVLYNLSVLNCPARLFLLVYFFLLVVTKHPKNTFAALFRIFS